MKKIVNGLLGIAIVCLFAVNVFAQQADVQEDQAVNKKVIKLVDRMEELSKKARSLDELGWSLEFDSIVKELYDIGKPAIPKLLDIVQEKDRHWIVRFTIVSMFKDKNLQDNRMLEPLLKILKDKNDDLRVRFGISTPLGVSGDKKALKTFIDIVEDETENKSVRISVINWGLGNSHMADKKSIDVLERILSISNDNEIRRSAIDTTGILNIALNDEKSANILIQTAKDKNNELRWDAINALGWNKKNKRAVKPLIEILRTDENRDIRGYAASSLGKIGDNQATDALIEALKDEYIILRTKTVEALENIKDKKAIKPLQEALKNAEKMKDEDSSILIKRALKQIER